MRLPISLS